MKSMAQMRTYWTPFKYLLLADLAILKTLIRDKVINFLIWVTITNVVAAYVMPAFGLSREYGVFLFAGSVATAGLFEVFPSAAKLVNDLTGDQVLLYQCTLPLPSSWVIMRMMLYNAINALLLGMCVLPMGKLILGDLFVVSQVSIIKCLLIIPVISLFYGAFSIFVAARIYDMSKIGNVWMRFVFPLWFLGCYQFSWASLLDAFPVLAYANFVNPLTYAMEGTRAAILGQEGFLNYWLCLGMLLLFYISFAKLGINALKKRLDVL